MAWRSPYNYTPLYRDEDWRQREIERVKDYQRRKLARFMSEVKQQFEQHGKPANTAEAMTRIKDAIEAGEIVKHRLGGSVWLQRQLSKVGVEVELRKTPRGSRTTRKDDDLLFQWSSECIGDAPAYAPPKTIDEIMRCLLGWYRLDKDSRDRAIYIGPKRVAAWLRTNGWESTRYGYGVVFKGMGLKRFPISSPAALRA